MDILSHVEGSLLVEEAGGGVVEAVGRLDAAVHGPRAVHAGPHLGSQHLAQLHSPLVKGVNAPHHSLRHGRAADDAWDLPLALLSVHSSLSSNAIAMAIS